MTEDLFSVARKTQGEVERKMVSNLGIGSIFEGIGNIINVIGKVTEESATPQEKLVRRSPPIGSGNEGG